MLPRRRFSSPNPVNVTHRERVYPLDGFDSGLLVGPGREDHERGENPRHPRAGAR